MKRPTETWKQAAKRTIDQALAECDEQGITEGPARRAFVSSKYPFGPRQYHPYKAWLAAMKEAFEPTKKPSANASDLAKLRAWQTGEFLRGHDD